MFYMKYDFIVSQNYKHPTGTEIAFFGEIQNFEKLSFVPVGCS